MGSGVWTRASFATYTTSSKYASLDSAGSIVGDYTAQEMFRQNRIAPELNPYNVIRECRDTEEHPETKPVILALDVTGSMGGASVKVAKELNVIMENIYKKVKDVEFLIMAIGDLAYDSAPIQASQFESDIRIAEQLDKVYFESGGGGNAYESYTAAWYFGLKHCDLDCWKRGKKGIIITLGDEPLNPYLPHAALSKVTGDSLQADVETDALYEEVVKKFDVFHLAVDDKETSYRWHKQRIEDTFGSLLGISHYRVVNLNNLASAIADIVIGSAGERANVRTNTSEASGEASGEISW